MKFRTLGMSGLRVSAIGLGWVSPRLPILAAM